jgi:WD40 repeat protein
MPRMLAITCGMFLLALPVLARQGQAPSATSPDQKRFARANGKTFSVFDAATQKELIRVASHTGDVTALAFSPDGKLLVSGSDDRSVRLFDAATGKELLKLPVGAAVEGLTFSQDARSLAVKLKDGKTDTFDVATGKKIQ